MRRQDHSRIPPRKLSIFELVMKYARPLIAVFVTVATFGFGYLIVLFHISHENREVVMFLMGVFAAKLGDITGYYFATSKDKSDADQNQLNPPADPPKA